MSEFRRTFSITSDHEVNGLSRTAYSVADKFQIDCKIDREVIKTGWFSKEYEYDIDFTGDKEMVDKTIYAMRTYIVKFYVSGNSKSSSNSSFLFLILCFLYSNATSKGLNSCSYLSFISS